jgi:hypothetical protein
MILDGVSVKADGCKTGGSVSVEVVDCRVGVRVSEASVLVFAQPNNKKAKNIFEISVRTLPFIYFTPGDSIYRVFWRLPKLALTILASIFVKFFREALWGTSIYISARSETCAEQVNLSIFVK